MKAAANGRPRTWEHVDLRLYGGRHGIPPPVVAEIQKARLCDAMIAVVAEVGYQSTSVEKVIAHAGMSRRTFYDLFGDKEHCFIAAYDDVIGWLLSLTIQAHGSGCSAVERLGSALDAFLGFWAGEPAAARACVVEALAAGPWARARRAEAMRRLERLLGPDLRELRGNLEPFAAEAFVGGLHELVYNRADRDELDELPALSAAIVAAEAG